METSRYPHTERSGHSLHPKACSTSSQTSPIPLDLNPEQPPPHNVNIKIPTTLKSHHIITNELQQTPTPIRKAKQIILSSRNKKTEKSETRDIFWEQINQILNEHEFPQMKLIQDKNRLVPDYSSLAETVICLVHHISLNFLTRSRDEKIQQGKIEELKIELKNAKIDLNEINEKYHELIIKLKEKNEIIKESNEKLARFNDFENILEAMKSSLKDKPKEIFKQVMQREYDPDLENDLKIMSIIMLYEHSKIDEESYDLRLSTDEDQKYERNSYDSSDLDSILNKLEVKTPNEALEAIDKMQQVVLIIPNIEGFINSIYKVLFSLEPDIALNMDQILPTIISMKIRLISLEKFRKSICENFELDLTTPDDMIIEKSESLKHFNRLFKSAENEDKTIEEVFIFVYEMKRFLQIARESLNLSEKIDISYVLEKIIRALNSRNI